MWVYVPVLAVGKQKAREVQNEGVTENRINQESM